MGFVGQASYVPISEIMEKKIENWTGWSLGLVPPQQYEAVGLVNVRYQMKPNHDAWNASENKNNFVHPKSLVGVVLFRFLVLVKLMPCLKSQSGQKELCLKNQPGQKRGENKNGLRTIRQIHRTWQCRQQPPQILASGTKCWQPWRAWWKSLL